MAKKKRGVVARIQEAYRQHNAERLEHARRSTPNERRGGIIGLTAGAGGTAYLASRIKRRGPLTFAKVMHGVGAAGLAAGLGGAAGSYIGQQVDRRAAARAGRAGAGGAAAG